MIELSVAIFGAESTLTRPSLSAACSRMFSVNVSITLASVMSMKPFAPPVRSVWPTNGKSMRFALLTNTTNAWPKKSVTIAR